METETVTKEPIAVIGLGCVLPDAPDVGSFWNNLLEGRDSVREVPADRWDADMFWDADKNAPGKTYTKIGAFVDDDSFNGVEYRMPPKVVEQIDPSQRWALAATRQAFKDAGYETGLKGDEGKGFDRTRCAVILGNAMGGEQMKLQTKVLYWPQVEKALRTDADFAALPADRQEAVIGRAREQFHAGVPPITEDSMPGTLSNVAAGRIANVFDLAGKNFTTDAACASSIAALDAAIDTLRRRESDMVVWGGTDRSMDITPYVEFSKIGALSPDGTRPFDKDANGFVMGEGCAVFLLKRLTDAEREGDKIYAVVRGVGGSSDGKGKGITAPNPVGQVKAVIRAYEEAGVDPATLGYLEAHGTSTPVGDPVELQAAAEAFRDIGATPAAGSIAVGSVKSNLGHLKSAAGAAGALKAILALHHGIIPPSINVRELNPRIDWGKSPFQVATAKTDWPQPADHPRRAAVSSFGFGGTNFHLIMEQHVPGHLKVQEAAVQAGPSQPTASAASTLDEGAFRRHMQTAAGLEAEAVVLSPDNAGQAAGITAPTFAETGEGPRLRDMLHPLTAAGVTAPQRVGFHMAGPEDAAKKLALAQKAMADPNAARLAFNQGVYLGEGRPDGKVAFLFPGQGTQYVNMGRDLAAKYQVVADTFDEADEVLASELDGVKLTDILWPTPDTEENRKASEEKLKLTEFTQPAVLAMDTAILRLLKQWGMKPDVVAGHSLGEYGALVAAGVLSFADALHAVAARGREMAHVEVPDLGKMASISADWHVVDEAIREVDGYVICANKNCPSQTVIAGSSDGVDAAVGKLQGMGLQAMYLPVSAAFHSKIVAPASEPLRRVLGRLEVKAPQVDVITNVGARAYPPEPDAIRDNLAVQVASPVDWIGTIEKMYADGVRTFIEVGPKRALSGFVADILKEKKDILPVFANHPKKGGIASINELFAFLGATGFEPKLPALDDAAVYTQAFRDPTARFRTVVPVDRAAATDGALAGPAGDPRIDVIADSLAKLTAELDAMRGGAPAAAMPAAAPVEDGMAAKASALGMSVDPIGISGASVGLPGANKPLFDDKDWDRILAGENLITSLSEEDRERMVSKNIVRLVKGKDGQATFQSIHDMAQVIHLAARRGGFDLADWGVGEDLASVLDKTSQYALAAGLEALKDAGIPLQRTYIETSTGGHLPKAWKLPASLQSDTGIIFASAFPGYDNLIGELSRSLADRYAGRSLDDLQLLYNELTAAIEDADLREQVQAAFDREFSRLQDVLPDHGAARYEFNRKFLFSVLSMGHAQLAQFLGARGPNTQVNAACASTTQAIAIAEDWIRTGRCRRVLVVGADDATSDNMMEWIGSGFLASGAATTKADVTEAALPFDARRHGMIIGMGAVGLLVEAEPETEARGMRPIAHLLATEVSNSAFHGSRLDIEHIAGEMQKLVRKALANAAAFGRDIGPTPEAVAASTLFMSHETYTPARGGSAAAEIHALRATFGAAADQVVVANTKGFTGHPQGAGIEDAVVLKCLQRGQVPPIPNLKQRDPELGDLNLSTGGDYDVRFGLRLAAGFGSQVAMTFTELAAREDERIADERQYKEWLTQVSGLPDAATEIVDRTLRIVDQGPPARKPRAVDAPEAQEAPIETADASAPPAAAHDADALVKVTTLVAEKTGYPMDLLEPDLDMEADLGIDTVKQAELFGELRETFGVPLDESLKLSDYNTLRKVASYMGGGSAPSEVPASPTEPQGDPGPGGDAAPDVGQAAATDDALGRVTAVVADKTGYPVDLLEPDLDLEADLGIDTVKQAELFGELREMFGVPLDESLKLADYNTLRKVASYMGSGSAPSEVPASPSEPQGEPGPGEDVRPVAAPPATTIGRFVAKPRAEALPDSTNGLPSGSVASIGRVPERLLAAGSWTTDGGPPVGLIVWATEPGAIAPGEAFDAAKAHAATLRFVAIVTAQDGAHGLVAPRDAAMAGLAGLGKALRKELPEALVKVIDLHPDHLDADLVAAELRHGGRRAEVAYDASGTRHVVDVVATPLDVGVPDLLDKTVLVSGGAQGITAELLASVAEGARLILLGRTEVPAEAAEWVTWDEDAWKAEEARVIAGLREAGEKPTPVEVRKRVDRKRKAADVRRNIDRLKAAGAQVLYAAVDVTDADAVASTLAKARGRFGPIHAVIHAAGIEISKMLADKPRDQFELVYGIKTAGLENLLAATQKDPLALIAGFGSVAGRFGNIGQTDYSAANEAMAKRITQEAQARGVATAFTIAWGPWGEIGMATRGGIMTVLEQSGVTPIATADGVAAWRCELATPGIREAVICGELGALDADKQIVREEAARHDADDGSSAGAVPDDFRLVRSIESLHPGQRVVAGIVLDRADDAYLDDHAIDGVPLLPGVFGIEAFAEAASLIAPTGTTLHGARDVRFAAPLKQHKDTPVHAKVEATARQDGGSTRIDCVLTSRFIGPDGEPHGEPRTHFEASLVFGAPREGLHTEEVPSCDRTFEVASIYPPFFHGPSFQVLDAAGPFDRDEGAGLSRGPQGDLFSAGAPDFRSHPLVTEALFQLCGLQTLVRESTMSLPAGIARLDIYEGPTEDLRLWCRADGKTGEGLRRFDAAACTPGGDVVVRLVGYTMVDLGPAKAPQPTMAADPEGRATETPAADAAPDDTPLAAMAPRDALDIASLDAALPEIDGVVFAAVGVPAEPPVDDPRLTEAERTQVGGFAAPKRACEWAAGRLAAKQAARRAAPELGDADVTVAQDPGTGQPILMVRGQRSPAKISITHRDGIAIAAIADEVVGIDIEPIEERPGPWWSQSFSGDEIDHLRTQADADLAATCAWTAKESCLKRAGTGMQAALHDLRVELGGDGAIVRGPWGDWSVQLYHVGEQVLAVTTPGLDRQAVAAEPSNA